MYPDDEPTDVVQALLRTLDHPVPKVTAEAIAARARAPGRVTPAWRWAAAILLTVGVAGAAFALPGSPFRRWASTLGAVVTGRGHPDAGADSASAPQAPSPDHGRAGIAVPPGRALLIVIDRPAPAALALVSLVDGAEVIVRAPAGSATFTTDAGRLVVEGRGAAPPGSAPSTDTFAIDIPRESRRVEIRAGPARVFLKERDRITSARPARPAGAGGPWLLPLGAAGSSR
jgi:hypothetical protein